nr:MATE family efflux transporter [Candidatus Pantoea persica]
MLFLFMSMSTTGLTAQAFGAQDRLALARALTQPLLTGALFILLRDSLGALTGKLAGGDPAVLAQAARFMYIRWLSAPATLANMVLLGWLLGVQYARVPVLLLLVGNGVNILLDLWLVLGLKWGVAGAATSAACCALIATSCCARCWCSFVSPR